MTNENGRGWRNRIVNFGTMRADQFQAHPRNWRTHPPAQRRALATSLNKVGWVGAVLVNRQTGHLLDGHERLWQALEQGDDTPVPYIEVDVSEDEEHLILATLDPIGAMAETDAEMLAGLLAELGDVPEFDDADISALLAEIAEQTGVEVEREVPADPSPQIDRAEELRDQWQTERGQVWEILSASVPGRAHRLMCGDSTSADDVATLMQGERADCVFTSPPYAVGVDYGEYQDTIDNLRAMLPLLSRSWLDVVMDGGFAVVNFGDIAPARNIANTDEPCEYPMALEYWPVFRADGWLLWSRRIWCKPTPRVHSPWCIQSNRAATDFEHLWTWRKPGKPIVARIDGEFSSVNGWIDTSHLQGVAEGKEVHGAGMATGIAQWMLTTHSRRASFVFEPFVGTGTTLVACEQTGRVGYGMEIEPKYVAVTLQRLSDMGLVARRVDA